MFEIRRRNRLLGVLVLASLALACGRPEAPAPAAAAAAAVASAPNPIERGQYLVGFGGCGDCHTPKKMGPKGPEPDPTRLLSGHPEEMKVAGGYASAPGSPWTVATNDGLTAWSGPWGVSFAANLTPDTTTGLRSGVWTEELFIKAMRTGQHMGTARSILPPMPWQDLAKLTDADLKAIWAYLGTIPAVANHVPDPIAPGPPPAK